jgi:hypothetical protein
VNALSGALDSAHAPLDQPAQTIEVNRLLQQQVGHSVEECFDAGRDRAARDEHGARSFVGEILTQAPVKLDAVHAVHHEVTQDDVVAFAALQTRKRLGGLRHAHDLMVCAERATQSVAQERLIIDDEDAPRTHVFTGSPSRFGPHTVSETHAVYQQARRRAAQRAHM